jgi:hypothetical protein
MHAKQYNRYMQQRIPSGMQRSVEAERAVMQETLMAEGRKLEDMRQRHAHEHQLFVQEVSRTCRKSIIN